MLKIITIFAFFISSTGVYAQFPFDTSLKLSPDTLYFPFKDDIQLIIIDNYDTYNNYGSWYDACYPRGGSWFMDNGPAPKNVYLFRDKKGKIIKAFNSNFINENSLENTAYFNTDELSLMSILDYIELNNHLKFFEDDKVGLIDLKGEIIVPAIYDDIRKYQDRGDKRDKLIIVKDRKFGFLDSNLKVLFPPVYRTKIDTNYLGYPEHNIIDGENIVVFKEDKCGMISEKGEILIDFLFDNIRVIHDGMYMGLDYRNENEITHALNNFWDWGYQVRNCFIFDSSFNIITRLEDFEYIQYYGINRFIVKKDNKFGVLNHLGEIVVPLEYDILSQENGGYHVTKNGKCGFLNLEGELVIPCEYERIYFYGKAIYVTQGGLIGVYSLEYKLIADPQFAYKTWDMGKYILTRKDGSKGFVQHLKEDSYYQSPEGEIIKL